jgi:hypothetical protein
MKEIQEFVAKKCLEKFNVDPANHILPIWKLNLAVILNAAKEKMEMKWQDGYYYISTEEGDLFEWELMTENGLEVLFDSQPEKTQIAIANLLGYKD